FVLAGGPVETVRFTALPTATLVPLPGVWLITLPAGTVGLDAVVRVPTTRPALVRLVVAAACVSPATFGTVTVGLGAQARIALLTFSRPPVVVAPAIAGIGSTVFRIIAFRPAVVREHAESTNAAAPDTCGVAIEVPLNAE